MQLKFFGTGGAFDPEMGNSACWVDFKGIQIQLDCGHSVYPKLRKHNLAGKADYFLITHLHGDHVGSLSTSILHYKHMLSEPQKPKILYPDTPNGRQLRDNLITYLSFSLMRVDDCVEFIPLNEIEGIDFIDTKGLHVKGMESFGFSFKEDKKNIFYSGDLGFPERVFERLGDLPDDETAQIFHEVCFFKNKGVHTYFEDLMKQAGDHEVFGYHTNPIFNLPGNEISFVQEHPEFLL